MERKRDGELYIREPAVEQSRGLEAMAVGLLRHERGCLNKQEPGTRARNFLLRSIRDESTTLHHLIYPHPSSIPLPFQALPFKKDNGKNLYHPSIYPCCIFQQ